MDVGIVISAPILHIIELKVLSDGALVGPEQLGDYLRNQQRDEGWLVVVDARPPDKKTAIPNTIRLKEGGVAHVVVVDINPPAPSSKNESPAVKL